MHSRLIWTRKAWFGTTCAAWFLATLVGGQAAGLWGEVKTFLTENELNGTHVQLGYGDTTRYVFAGVFRAELSDGRSFLAFCTDAFHPHRSGLFESFGSMPENNLEGNPIWVTGGGARAAAVYNTHIASVSGMAGSAGPGSAPGDIAAAALQVAIWKALYDETTDLNDGLFRVPSNGSALQNDIIYHANLYLEGALAGYNDPQGSWNGDPNATWWRPVDQDGNRRNAQGLIGPSGHNPQPVPAPQGFALASLLAGGLGFLARRRMAS
jgi:hypothetical protein